MLDSLTSLLNQQPLLTLAIVIALGQLLGNFEFYGIMLGTSGILFVAMALGHLGIHLPEVLGDVGVALFVYAVGLQAGPHFLRTIRRHGWSFLLLALVTLAAAWGADYVFSKLYGLEAALATGIYAGALTSTPALAASLQAVNDPNISVGFGVAYPFGVIGVILFVQLVPRLLRIDLREEAIAAKADNGLPAVEVAWIAITNPQANGKTIRDIETMRLSDAVISRVYDQFVAMPAQANTHLYEGQHVRVVGTEAELRKMEMLLGPRAEGFQEPRSVITSGTLVVTEDAICGKTLAQLRFRERYGVTITRIWRDDFEFVPSGNTALEFGDEIRIVGDSADCQRVTEAVGLRPERLNETRFLPLGAGLLAGLAVGSMPIHLPGGLTVQLGMAGGPLLAGLIAGHFGRIGSVSFRMPVAARMFMNELGLVLFLGNAGMIAGKNFLSVVRDNGPGLLLAAVLVTAVPLFVAYLLARYGFRWDALTSLGSICGAMTCTPGLGAVTKLADSSAPAAAYVAVYPVALLTVSLLAPLLGAALRAW
ncbi:MAG: hypothetical protein L0Z07_00440 [Planctomycetes bacterium]|nr:hypothetical protein [Planctomycetota bacterium]